MELLTPARGVSKTPRDTRHAAGDFRLEDGNEKQNINACNIRFKIKEYTLKYQKPFVRANELQYKIKGE